jgi:hypothetical protein
MTIEAIARHSGVLRYRSDSGDRLELVPDELMLAKESDGNPVMGRLGGAPATNEHPPQIIRFDEVSRKAKQVGTVQDDIHIYKDDSGVRKVRVRIDVTDPVTQQEIRDGKKRGVSMGYMCGVKADSGEWNGQPYTHVQEMPLRIDHLAIVANPRAPEALITRFDSADLTDIAYAESDATAGIMQVIHVDACCEACAAAEPKPKKKKPPITKDSDAVSEENTGPVTPIMFGSGMVDVPDSLLSGLHADGLIELVELNSQEFLVGADFANSLRADGLIEHEDACGKGWMPGGANGKCKRVPKGTAKKVATESAGIRRLGKGSLNAENKARLETLRKRQAAKQKLATAAAGEGSSGRTFAAKAASGKGVKGMNVVAPKGFSVADEQEITRSTRKVEKDFAKRQAAKKAKVSAQKMSAIDKTIAANSAKRKTLASSQRSGKK